MNRYLMILLQFAITQIIIAQNNQFPQIYYNGQGIGGANLILRSAPSLVASIETSLLGIWQIGAVNEEISLETQGNTSWAKECLLTINGQIKYGYILSGEYYGRISAVITNAIVNATNLNIRENPNSNAPIVKINGLNSTYAQTLYTGTFF
ncbi:MAG: hypothetical protein IPG55_16590 [Saprospiraceae bacterium]|nr:hypothetical protein [Candidatus Defluviibacterium haderslevense]